MEIISINKLKIDHIKVMKFARFCDERGYFSEILRKSDVFKKLPELEIPDDAEFVQCNESYSKRGTVRGLHFQWNPYMGKLVRTVVGRMVDMILDIRKGSPTLGKIILYDMIADSKDSQGEWIWIPPGFAHGCLFPEESIIEYLCTGEYNPNCEATISPMSEDIMWDLCDKELKKLFTNIISSTHLITTRDRCGLSLRSNNFVYKG
jgi:dTDP-4-dehydrorhamnose 3,5-epimerase